ncbi:MAG: hypothetical protein QOG17_2782 [Gammaproteobacteria bacterium]|jgi:CBS domain-containing protein|nr:hypothetical protein [Gammaproteobacteria bacterium]
MFLNNDLSEGPRLNASGVLPMRRPPAYPDLSLKDPALHGMTDFMHKFPISVAPQRPIDEALADMMRFSVRALLVISGESVVGLITSYDIEGARPLNFLQRSSITRREHIRVGDIMTEWEDLPTVDWSTMQSARIADLLEIFHGVGLMHLLVVEGESSGGATIVRGLVSRARLERRLNGTGS